MLRYAMLCYAALCYAMLCYAMLCYAALCYAALCYIHGIAHLLRRARARDRPLQRSQKMCPRTRRIRRRRSTRISNPQAAGHCSQSTRAHWAGGCSPEPCVLIPAAQHGTARRGTPPPPPGSPQGPRTPCQFRFCKWPDPLGSPWMPSASSILC